MNGTNQTIPIERRRLTLLVFVTALLFYLATAGGSMGTKDAVGMYQITVRMVRDGAISQPPGWIGMAEARGPDGRYYAPFGIGQSVYNVPFYLAGRLAETLTGVRLGATDAVPKAIVVLGNAVAAAGVVAVAFLFALRLTQNAWAACAAALSLGFGTLLWPYARFGFNAPLTTLCLISAMYFIWTGARSGGSRRLLWGGFALGAALLTRHEIVLAAVPIGVWAYREQRRAPLATRHSWLWLPGFAACVVLWMLYNYARFGSLLYAGYRPAFGAGGWYGLLASPEGSFFLYSPIAAVGTLALWMMWKRDRSTAGLFISVILTLFTFYASLADWRGVRSYGPRYLVPLLPLFCIPLAYAFRDWRKQVAGRLLLGAVVLSIIVQLPAVLVDPARTRLQGAYGASPTASTDDEERTIATTAEAAWHAVVLNAQIMTGTAERPSLQPSEGGSLSDRMAYSLDFWWMYLYHLGRIRAALALACGAGFGLLGGLALGAVARAASRWPPASPGTPVTTR